MIEEKQNNILLDSHGDLFGLKVNDVFNRHSKDTNIVCFRMENAKRLELNVTKFHSDVNIWFTDDIEQLEKLVEWAKALQKGAKKQLKKLQKVEVESST